MNSINNFDRVCPHGNHMIDGFPEIERQTEALTTIEEVREYIRQEVCNTEEMWNIMRTFRAQGFVKVERNSW